MTPKLTSFFVLCWRISIVFSSKSGEFRFKSDFMGPFSEFFTNELYIAAFNLATEFIYM